MFDAFYEATKQSVSVRPIVCSIARPGLMSEGLTHRSLLLHNMPKHFFEYLVCSVLNKLVLIFRAQKRLS